MHHNYKNKIDICIIISISIVSLIFFYFPLFDEIENTPEYYVPIVIVEYMPKTKQNKQKPPPPPNPLFPVEATEDELFEDVIIDSIPNSNADHTVYLDFSKNMPLDFKPRQILEVIPESIASEYKGEIILLLKIGLNGKMIDYKVVSNTVQTEIALQYAINAARKSRWEAGKVASKSVEYWIEKIYKFNM